MTRVILTILTMTSSALLTVNGVAAEKNPRGDDHQVVVITSSERSEIDRAAVKGEIRELKTRLRDLYLKMHDERVKIIKDNPDFMKLHKKIMALHKELAIKIDRHPSMIPLIHKSRDIEERLDGLTDELEKKRLMEEAERVKKELLKASEENDPDRSDDKTTNPDEGE